MSSAHGVSLTRNASDGRKDQEFPEMLGAGGWGGDFKLTQSWRLVLLGLVDSVYPRGAAPPNPGGS